MTNKLFIFDVDGTLTPSRSKIDPEFSLEFLRFCNNNDVVLVSGSDYGKIQEQVGDAILHAVQSCFNCSGNERYQKGKLQYAAEWEMPGGLLVFLNEQLAVCTYPIRVGKHFERRSGMLNFSIVGRNVTIPQREAYYKWDTQTQYRLALVNSINTKWPELRASIGGQISIDISPKAWSKVQILKHFKDDNIIFFGDQTCAAGNDYEIAQAVTKSSTGVVYPVDNWKETQHILKSVYSKSADG